MFDRIGSATGMNHYADEQTKAVSIPATLTDQLNQQYNYHLMKAAEIKAVLDKMSPEIKDFMEAWYKINR